MVCELYPSKRVKKRRPILFAYSTALLVKKHDLNIRLMT